MKNKKQLSSAIITTIGILELMPYGAVLNFARSPEEGGVIRETYSYFDLTPFGYANFGPLLTAISSILIMIVIIVLLFEKGQKLWTLVAVLSAVGVITSLMPLMFGIEYYTAVGFTITLLLAVQFIISIWDRRKTV